MQLSTAKSCARTRFVLSFIQHVPHFPIKLIDEQIIDLFHVQAVAEFNEEMDLRQSFTGQPDKRIGQALCSQLGSVLVPTYMRVKSHTVCFGQGWSVARDTGLRSSHRFICVLGRFQTVL